MDMYLHLSGPVTGTKVPRPHLENSLCEFARDMVDRIQRVLRISDPPFPPDVFQTYFPYVSSEIAAGSSPCSRIPAEFGDHVDEVLS